MDEGGSWTRAGIERCRLLAHSTLKSRSSSGGITVMMGKSSKLNGMSSATINGTGMP